MIFGVTISTFINHNGAKYSMKEMIFLIRMINQILIFIQNIIILYYFIAIKPKLFVSYCDVLAVHISTE